MPENLGVPLQGDRDAGELGGAHQGCQVPIRPPILSFEFPLQGCYCADSSTLAWKIPWMEEPGRLQSMGSLRVGHD